MPQRTLNLYANCRHLLFLTTFSLLIFPSCLRYDAIAQWICLGLPICRPGFESQVHHLHFKNLQSILCYNGHEKGTKRQPKETGFGPFLKINDFSRNYLRKFLKNSFVFKVSHSRRLISFSLQITVTTWSATWVLCCWKQLVCQLCLCHCPNCLFVIVIC